MLRARGMPTFGTCIHGGIDGMREMEEVKDQT